MHSAPARHRDHTLRRNLLLGAAFLALLVAAISHTTLSFAASIDLSISKTASTSTPAQGSTFTYSIVVTNTSGIATSGGITVTDVLPSGVGFASSVDSDGFSCETTPAVGSSGTVACSSNAAIASGGTYSVLIAVTATGTGLQTNTATVASAAVDNDPDVTDNSDTENVTITAAQADLRIAKSATASPVASGGTIVYTLVVTNDGPSPASNLTLTDPMPANATSAIAASGLSCNGPVTPLVTCTAASLAVGASATVTITTTAPTGPTSITNTATVYSSTTDPVTSDNSASVTTSVSAPVATNADLSVSKTFSTGSVAGGGTATVTLSVFNAGPDAATNVDVQDNLPAGFSQSGAVTATGGLGGCSAAASTIVTCTAATLAAGATATMTFNVTAPATGGSYTNVAFATSDTADSDSSDNLDSASITVVAATTPTADLFITKADSSDPVVTGGAVLYTLTFGNNGPSAVTGAGSVTVTDVTAANLMVTAIVTSAGVTCSASAVLPALGPVTCLKSGLGVGEVAVVTIAATAPSSAQTLNNTAIIVSTVNDPSTANNADSESTVISAATVASTDLAISKGDSVDPVAAGGTFVYTIVVSNIGLNAAANVNVRDSLPPGFVITTVTPSSAFTTTTDCDAPGDGPELNCVILLLAAGASGSVTVVGTAPAVTGVITNIATVTSDTPDTNAANNIDSETTTVVAANADLSITKVDSPDPVPASGGLVYTLTVTNNGPDAASAVLVTDTLPPGMTAVTAVDSSAVVGDDCTIAAGPPQTITCDFATIAAGTNVTISVQGGAPVNPGSYTNTANVTSTTNDPDTSDNSATETTTVGAAPAIAADLEIHKYDSPDPVAAGAALVYTIVVANNGPAAAVNPVVNDTLPAGMGVATVTASDGTVCNDLTAPTIQCNALNDIPAGGVITITIVGTAPGAAGAALNTATVSSDTYDPNTGNNSVTEGTTVGGAGNTVNEADLSVYKVGAPNPAIAGAAFTYAIVVANAGPSIATTVVVTDSIPAGVTAVTGVATGGGVCGALAAGQISCTWATISPGGVRVVTLSGTAPVTQGSYDNTVAVTGGEPDPNLTNNSDVENMSVILGTADLAITKAESQDPVTVGAVFAYTITVVNNGPHPAIGGAIDDVLPAGWTIAAGGPATSNIASCPTYPAVGSGGAIHCNLNTPLSVGGVATLTIFVTADVAGTKTNTASVTATTPDGNAANNSASVSTTATLGSADLAIVKIDSPDPVVAGATLTFTLLVTNNGPDTATGVDVFDTLVAGLTVVSVTTTIPGCVVDSTGPIVGCAGGTMGPGTAYVVTIVVTPDATTVPSFSNTATVSADTPDPNGANNSDTESTQVTLGGGTGTTVDLAITKVDSPDPVAAGATLTYSLIVTNAGPLGATSVTVTDNLPPHTGTITTSNSFGATCLTPGNPAVLSCTGGTLPSGSAGLIQVVLTPATAGSYTNVATITADQPDSNLANNSDTETTTVTPAQADLSVVKTGSPSTLYAGGQVAYTLIVTNNGPSASTGVTVTDTLPLGLTYSSSVASQGTCANASGTVTCGVGTMAAGTVVSITIIANAATPGSWNNTASVTSIATGGGTIPPVTDPNPFNNNSNATTTINAPVADLSITKTSTPNPAFAGSDFTYTIVVTNNGPTPAQTPRVTDILPAGVVYRGIATSSNFTACGTVPAVDASGPIMCDLATLGVGEVASMTIIVRAANAGSYLNTATVTSRTPDAGVTPATNDPNTGNNSASTTTTVTALVADLSITKSDNPDAVVVGQPLTYTIVVVNNGPSTATGVVVTDTLPVGVTYVSATPSTGTCAYAAGTLTCNLGPVINGGIATVAVVVTPTVAGTLSNTASVTSIATGAAPVIPPVADPNAANNSATATTTVIEATVTDIGITKIGSPNPAAVGFPLTYTIVVSNYGPRTATAVVVKDVIPAGMSLVSATPTQGALCTGTSLISCALGTIGIGSTASVTIVVTPNVPGVYTNTATVQTTTSDPNVANNSASVTTVVNAASPIFTDLSLYKADSPDPATVGIPLAYTIVVANNGPTAATNVIVKDTVSPGLTWQDNIPSQGTCNNSSVVVCNLGTLLPGATATVTIVVLPQYVGVYLGTVATVTSDLHDPNASNNSDSESTTVTTATTPGPQAGSADLSITMTDTPDPSNIGTPLTYTMIIQNNGPQVAHNVKVSDIIPAGVSYSSATPSQGICSGASHVICSLGTIDIGGVATISLVVNPTLTGIAIISNTASVNGDETDSNAANDSATVQTIVNQTGTGGVGADLSIAKTASPNPAVTGVPLTFTIIVENHGPLVANAVKVSDTLPLGVTFTSATSSRGTCAYDEPTKKLNCDLGDMIVGAVATITVISNPVGNGSMSNTTIVTAVTPDPVSANNVASVGFGPGPGQGTNPDNRRPAPNPPNTGSGLEAGGARSVEYIALGLFFCLAAAAAWETARKRSRRS